jgi:AcrR family transcriptional regulator
MPIVVEHSKRREQILDNALEVFIKEGFEDTTFQKIADACGITRTTLYLYFHSKTEIFKYSIKFFLTNMEEDIMSIREEAGLSFIERIKKIILLVIQQLEENRRLLKVILDYTRTLRKANGKPDIRIRKRTVRLRHILADLVIDGISAGEIMPVNIKCFDELVYGLFESAIFRLVILGRGAIGEICGTADMVLSLLTPRRPEMAGAS